MRRLLRPRDNGNRLTDVMEETFDKIHDNKGPAVSSGVNPNAVTMAANEAAQAAKKGGTESGVNSGFNDVMPVPNLASFSVYWDVSTKEYKVFEPRVVGPGANEISVTPADLGNGIYCCDIRRTSDGGSYEAKIKLLAQVERDENTVAVVRLFQISDDKVVQYHTGVINVTDMSITGEEGDTEGSQADTVSGDILMSGVQGSGITVLSFVRNKSEKHVCVDLEGRDRSDTFGIHSVTDSGGNEKAKILSTADVELPGGGGGPDTVTVLTGFTISVVGEELKVTFKKAQISGVKQESTSEDTETLFDLERFNAVEDVNYDETTKMFTKTKHTIYVPGMGASADPTEEVFTATPHSNEL